MLGNKIKSLREAKNMTQHELANAIDISQSSIGMIEGNKRPAGRKTLIKLADFFNVTVDYLLCDDNDTSLDTTNDSKEYENLVSKDIFENPEEAMKFILMQPSIMGFGGFDVNKMSDDEILEFANELLNQLKLISYKYKK